jgi:hypothetical protein
MCAASFYQRLSSIRGYPTENRSKVMPAYREEVESA